MVESSTALRSARVLLVEDNLIDQRATERALCGGLIQCELHITRDGEEALDYLYHRGEFEDLETSPRPDLILLDLNMPRIGGREVLQTIKQDEDLAMIPVIVLTTSDHEVDVVKSYELGCSSYIPKPVEIAEFIDALQQLGQYWFRLVLLPPQNR